MEFQLLGDICEYRKGKINVSELTEQNYVSTENLLPNKSGLVDAASMPSTVTTQIYYKNDILVSNIRPYFKKIWFAKSDGGCSNDVLVFSAKSGVDHSFLYYVLADDKFFEYSMSTAKGTKMPRGDKNALMNYEVPKIDITEQRKIGNFLRDIDDKIQINNQINRNLLEQLDLAWNSIFEDVLTDISLGNVVKTMSGGTPSRRNSDFYDGGVIYWVKSKELCGSYIIDTEEQITKLAIQKSAAKLIPAYSILIAMYGATVGEYAIISDEMTCNQAICALIPNEYYPSSYLFELAKQSKEKLINMAIGSAQQNISQVLIKQLPIHSDKSKIKQYDDIAKSMMKTIEKNIKENIRLAELRDALLPKLMLGELDVSNIEI